MVRILKAAGPGFISQLRDLPGSPVVKNLSSNLGDVGSIPDLGTKHPQAVVQLSAFPQPERGPWAATKTSKGNKSILKI